MFLLFLLSQVISRSRFGAPGTDEIELDLTDGFEVLERGLRKPSGIKDISAARYSNYIEPSTYPYPGHSLQCNWTDLRLESYYIRTNFRRSNLTQNECYRHPAGALQFETTQEDVDRADRVKVRTILTPRYNRHYTPVFFPPGELIQIDIMPSLANRVSIRFNKYMSNIWDVGGSPKYRARIDQTRFEAFPLASAHNTVSIPYGGVPDFDTYSNLDPIEMNITGVILCPFFKYGLHSDTEWETQLSRLPGPVATIETGNIVISVPAKYVRSATRLNDACKWWRSAYQISQTTAKDGYNAYDSRPLNILELNFECFVPAGAAVAFVGCNYCHFPQGWVDSQVNINSYMDNPWGNVHEMNHHHQGGWGPNGGVDEISNNIINLVTFAQSNQCSKNRPTGGWGRYSYANQPLKEFANAASSNDLYAEYSIFIHQFGWEIVREFIRADQSDDTCEQGITRRAFGDRRNAELARMVVKFKCNPTDFVRFYYALDSQNFPNQPFKQWLSTYEQSFGKMKPFHPVANKYMVGKILPEHNNKAFYSARPYLINYRGGDITEQFNFTPTYRNGFGSFTLKEVQFQNDRKSDWTETATKGVYTMSKIPDGFSNDPTYIENISVIYSDTSLNTNEDVKVLCQLQYNVNGAYCSVYAGDNGDNNPYSITDKTVFWAAKNRDSTSKVIHNKSPISSISIIQEAWMHGYFGYTTGYLSVPESGEYVFALAVEDEGAFYLSENELAIDPDTDAPYLINYQSTPCYNYLTTNRSNPIKLSAYKSYHFLLYGLRRATGKGGNKMKIDVGYQVGPDSFQRIPNNWVSVLPASAEKLWNNQYKPIYQRMLGLDVWDGQNFKQFSTANWKVLNYPGRGSRGYDCINNSKSGEGRYTEVYTDDEVSRVLFDNDATTEFRSRWWGGRGPVQKFPMHFDIDMAEKQTFSELNIMPTGNQGWFPMKSSTEITVANDADFTDGVQTFSTTYDSKGDTVINLGKKFAGRYLRVKFFNNTYGWKDGLDPKVSITGIQIGEKVTGKKVIPMTHSKMIKYASEWKQVRNGWYYNGKGFTGQNGDFLEICLQPGITKFGIIGDSFPGMGTAEVTLNGATLPGHGNINGPYDINEQTRRLKYANKAYRVLLTYADIGSSDAPRIVRVNVTSGAVTLTGILTDLEPISNVLEKDDEPPYDFSKCPFADFTPVDVNTDNTTDGGFYVDPIDDEIVHEVKKKNSTPIILGVLIPVAVIGIAIVAVAFYLYYHPEIVFNMKSKKKNMEKDSLVNSSFVI